MKNIINSALISGCALALLLTVYLQNRQIAKLQAQKPATIDSLRRVIDSLHDEAFMWKTTADRYDIVIERFKEDNPDQVEKIEEYYKDTE